MLTLDTLKRVTQQLLSEFRTGSSFNDEIVEECLKEISQKWDNQFPDFPVRKMKRGSFIWKFEKGERSKYLIQIIKKSIRKLNNENAVIINPACYTGKRARQIAKILPDSKVIGTDINQTYNNRWHLFQKLIGKKEPKNYQFLKDNIFDSKLNITPEIVVFFGACGSVSDAIMDYAIREKSPLLICRICCPDNIGGNTLIKKKNSLLNLYFRYKNWSFQKKKQANQGDYFSDVYSMNVYPRSNTVKQLSNPEEYRKIAQDSVDNEVCEALINLDRCCYLVEHGYDVVYKDELFFAKKH